MNETNNEYLQQDDKPEEHENELKMEVVPDTETSLAEEEEPEESQPTESGNFREAAYVVLFIAAVFVINAMETGSYRTPWPVAIVTTVAGLGLLGYSFKTTSDQT